MCVCVCSVCVCARARVCVCLPPRLLITSGVMWRDMDPCDWLNKLCSFCMAAIVGIVSRLGLRNEARRRS